MKLILGRENEIINLKYVIVIDTVETNGKFEIQAILDQCEFSVVLASFEHMDHVNTYLKELWSKICSKTSEKCNDSIQLKS